MGVRVASLYRRSRMYLAEDLVEHDQGGQHHLFAMEQHIVE